MRSRNGSDVAPRIHEADPSRVRGDGRRDGRHRAPRSRASAISKSTRALDGIELAALGFHDGQNELLMAIDVKGETVERGAEQLAIRPSTVSKMMDRLVGKGLVERVGDARDGRRPLLRITPAGIEARKMLAQARADLGVELGSGMCPEKRAAVIRELEEFARHIARRLR